MKKHYFIFTFIFLAVNTFALPTEYTPLALKADSYIEQATYHLNKSRTEQIVVSSVKPEGQPYSVIKGEEPDTFLYQTVNVTYAEEDINKALDFMKYGIENYPNRLDLYLVKLDICRTAGKKDCMVRAVTETLSQSGKIRNKWRTGGVYGGVDLLPQGRAYMLSRLQGAASSVLAKGDLPTAKKMTQKIINYYPHYVPALTVMGEIYMQEGKYTSAETVLKKATRLDQNDTYARDSLAELYTRTQKDSQSADYDIQSSQLKRGK